VAALRSAAERARSWAPGGPARAGSHRFVKGAAGMRARTLWFNVGRRVMNSRALGSV
jgi:hypothetical protein